MTQHAQPATTEPAKKLKAALLALPNTLASTVFGPMDILGQAGLMWNQLCSANPAPRFDVSLVSLDGQAVRCLNGAYITVAGAVADRDWDLIVVSAADVGSLPEQRRQLRDALLPQSHHGSRVASVCTGAFALAETGLLKQRRATTHWGFAPLFQKTYPDVHLQPDKLVTEDGMLFCSGGFNAYKDLCLHLIEHFHGFAIAEQTANALVLEQERNSQNPYRWFELQKKHNDKQVLAVQQHLERHFAETITTTLLADVAHLSERQLMRRFKLATGETLNSYLQRIRIERAKEAMRKGEYVDRSIEQCGYKDPKAFRDVFKKLTGLTPSEYRKKFSAVPKG
jgi:transcriptional regulator GlxA family with amidase domain